MISEKKENREMDCCPVIRFSWNAMGLMKRFIDFEPINNFLLLLLLSTIIVSGSIVLIFFSGGEEAKDSLHIPRVYFKRFLPVSNLVGTKKSPLL